MIRLCIFDLDGTLINSLQDLASSTNYALGRHGFPKRELHEYRLFLSDGLPKLLHRAIGGKYSEEEAMCLVDDFKEYYGCHYADCTRPYKGINELLDQLQALKIPLAVLSNKPDQFTRIIVSNLFPDTEFAMIQGKIEEFLPKPDPASLQHILKTLAVNPAEALYIGDSNVDVFTAHNAGVDVVGVTWGYRDKQELIEAGADYIVDSPLDIVKLL